MRPDVHAFAANLQAVFSDKPHASIAPQDALAWSLFLLPQLQASSTDIRTLSEAVASMFLRAGARRHGA